MRLNIRGRAAHTKNRARQWLYNSDETTKSRHNLAISNMAFGASANLVGGNFLTGFYLLLNADDAFIGLITIILTAGNMLQVLSPLLLERFPKRKKLLVGGRIGYHIIEIILIGLIPYLGFGEKTSLSLLVAFKLFITVTNAIMAPGFSIWHIKSIPEEIRAKYYSIFSIVYNLLIYLLVIIASTFADRIKASGRELAGLSYLRLAAVVFAALDVYFLLKIKEFPNEQDAERPGIISMIISPFRERKYLMTVAIACLWSFSASIPGPYYTIYLLKDLGVSYSFLTLVNMLNIPFLVFLTPVWARRINRTSWFRTLQQSITFYLLSYVVMAFVTGKTLFLYPVSMVMAYIFAPGINLVFSNIPYINMPKKNQTRYMGFYSTMNSVAAFVAVVISRQFILYTAEYRIRLFGIEMQNKQYLMLISAALLVLSAFVIAKIRRKTESHPE